MLAPCLCLLGLTAVPATLEQREQRGEVVAWLRAHADPPQPESSPQLLVVRLSGEVIVTLQVEGPAGLEVEPGKPLTAADGWRVRAAEPPSTATRREGRLLWQQVFRLQPLRPGDLPLPIAPLRLRTGPGAGPEITWKPLPVRVVTTVTRADLSELRDITPPEEPPPEPEPAVPWAWLGLGAAAVLVGAVAWGVARRRGRAAAPLPPGAWALRELDRLDVAAPTLGTGERYITLLSDTVRQYIELRFRLPAARQTTAEFLEAMRRSPHLTADQQTLLRELLERCDLVKFAGSDPSPEECRAAAAMARGFIEQTAPAAAEPMSG